MHSHMALQEFGACRRGEWPLLMLPGSYWHHPRFLRVTAWYIHSCIPLCLCRQYMSVFLLEDDVCLTGGRFGKFDDGQP